MTPCASALVGMKSAPMRSAAPGRKVGMDMILLAKRGYDETHGSATHRKRAISGEGGRTARGVRREARGKGCGVRSVNFRRDGVKRRRGQRRYIGHRCQMRCGCEGACLVA